MHSRRLNHMIWDLQFCCILSKIKLEQRKKSTKGRRKIKAKKSVLEIKLGKRTNIVQ